LLVSSEAVVDIGAKVAGSRVAPTGLDRVLASVASSATGNLLAVLLRAWSAKALSTFLPPSRRGGSRRRLGMSMRAGVSIRSLTLARRALGSHGSSVLREVGGRSLRILGSLRLLRREGVKLAGWWAILAPTALQWPPVDIVPRELADGHSGILMRIHLDEGKAAVRLEPRLDNITELLE